MIIVCCRLQMFALASWTYRKPPAPAGAFLGGTRSILTIAIRPTKRSSIDLVYHYYLQHKASDEIRDTSIDADPTGRGKRLGTEIDLIIGYEEFRNVEMKLALGYFIPGKALRNAGNAFFAGAEIEWGF